MIYSLFGFNMESNHRFKTPMAATDGPADLNFVCTPSAGQRTLDDSNRIYAAEHKNAFGESSVSLYRNGETEIMRFPRIADFVLRTDSITCELVSPEVEYMIEICLLGHVFGYFLERSGISAVHGTSVAVRGQAALFIADCGGGKSTLSASFTRAGFPLIADDISGLEDQGHDVVCRRGFPQVKLTPEQAQVFVGHAEGFPLVHPAFKKLSVPVVELGTFADTPAPVAAIYVLDRRNDPGTVRIEDVPSGEALMELIKNTFITEIIDATALRPARMKRLAEIVRKVPVKRLRYPSGYERLAEVHKAVLADLG